MRKTRFILTITASLFFIGTGAQASSNKLLDAYNNAQDYNNLIEAALSSNSEIGDLYAKKALGVCSIVNDNLEKWKSDINRPEIKPDSSRVQAVESLFDRCKNVSLSDLTSVNINSIGANRKQKSSAVNSLENSASKIDSEISTVEKLNGRKSEKTAAKIEERRQVSLNAAAANRDPLYADSLGLRLVLSKDKNAKTVYRVNGKEYPVNSKVDVGLAVTLVPCELGLQCDAKEFSVALPCASGVICDSSRYEAVQRMSKENNSSYDDILDVAKQIARGISTSSSK